MSRSTGTEGTMASLRERVRRRISAGANATPAERLCEHLREAPADPTPRTSRCGACEAQGTDWSDLRLCLACGEVGCCDSSPWKHAGAHAHETGHPVIRSFVPGESWRWCYVDEVLG